MFLEKMFGNTFGLIWLIVFSLAVLALIVWLFIKTDKVVENKPIVSEEQEKVEVSKEEIASVVEAVKDDKKEEKLSDYKIVEIDGSFKVRKVGSERTIRKFPTYEEASNYVKEKEND